MFECGCMDRDTGEHDQIFVEEGRPFKFTISRSISDVSLQQDLRYAITDHGGEVLDNDKGTDFVLVMSTDSQIHKRFKDNYALSMDPKKRRIRVKGIDFVENSVRDGVVAEDLQPPRKPGFPAGKARNLFTEEDDESLCRFLAMHCPYGGRTGIQLYERLCDSAELGMENAWAKAHPASSWRERYRRNKDRYNPIIEQYIIEFGTRKEMDSDEDEEQFETLPPVEHFDSEEQPAPRSRFRSLATNNGSDDEMDGSERDSLFGGGVGRDQETLRVSLETQEEEYEVNNALQLISHSTEYPTASISGPRSIPQENDSLSTRQRNIPAATAEDWPPARSRRRKRLSGVVTAPPATGTLFRSRKGKERAHEEIEDTEEEEEDEVDELDEDDDDDYRPPERPEVDKDDVQEEQMPHNPDVGKTVKEDLFLVEEEEQEENEDTKDPGETGGDIELLSHNRNAEDHHPPPSRRPVFHSSPDTTPRHIAALSGAAQKVAANSPPRPSTTPDDTANASNAERAIGTLSFSSSSTSIAEPKPKTRRRKQKTYNQLTEDAPPPRTTRARTRAAQSVYSPPPAKKASRKLERRGEDEDAVIKEEEEKEERMAKRTRGRPRKNKNSVIPEVVPEVVDEEMVPIDVDDDEDGQEDVKMEIEVEQEPRAPVARLEGDDESDSESKIASDDEQSLRSLGVRIPDVRGTRHQSRTQTARDVTSSRQQPVQQTPTKTARKSKPFVSPTISTTSGESFPRKETRASAMKRKHVNEEKRTPYKPPSGTRAAEYVRNTQGGMWEAS
ncbi:hypothetical protein L218DRAFT_988923 [Marasmius fiardii PR-910]|nr:hypothetical protein L218DRAFT_988923 [Marasmius fiardii PR-910]